MCAVFGLIDYKNKFTSKQREQILSVLSKECEVRGTDATGFAFNSRNELKIFKRPAPAHKMHLHLPEDANIILGHTRMATQGDKQKNFNNHPFFGNAGGERFALAHNGVIYNDEKLRKELKIPTTNIETDSYIAVQILEKLGSLSEKFLAEMAEKVSGSFVFTLLDKRNNSYFVKGDNPLALYHFKSGFYIYASTNSILDQALNALGLGKFQYEEIQSNCGDILKIDSLGRLTRSHFQYSGFYHYPYTIDYNTFNDRVGLIKLNRYAERCGIDEFYIDLLLEYGYTIEEVEDLICVPNAIEAAVEEILCEFDYCGEW